MEKAPGIPDAAMISVVHVPLATCRKRAFAEWVTTMTAVMRNRTILTALASLHLDFALGQIGSRRGSWHATGHRPKRSDR